MQKYENHLVGIRIKFSNQMRVSVSGRRSMFHRHSNLVCIRFIWHEYRGLRPFTKLFTLYIRRSTLVITPSRSVSTRCVPSVRRSRFWCSAQGNILTLQILVPKLFRFMLLANSSRLEPSASVSLSQRYPNPNPIYELEFNLQVHRGHCVLSTDHEAL